MYVWINVTMYACKLFVHVIRRMVTCKESAHVHVATSQYLRTFPNCTELAVCTCLPIARQICCCVMLRVFVHGHTLHRHFNMPGLSSQLVTGTAMTGAPFRTGDHGVTTCTKWFIQVTPSGSLVVIATVACCVQCASVQVVCSAFVVCWVECCRQSSGVKS